MTFLLLSLVLFIGTFIKIIQLSFWVKASKWELSQKHVESLPVGKYNVIVFGSYRSSDLRNATISVIDAHNGDSINVKRLTFIASGYSKLKVFYRVAAFQLEKECSILIHIDGLNGIELKRSRLFLKNLLFPKPKHGKILIGVTKKFNFLSFFITIALSAISIVLLVLSIKCCK